MESALLCGAGGANESWARATNKSQTEEGAERAGSNTFVFLNESRSDPHDTSDEGPIQNPVIPQKMRGAESGLVFIFSQWYEKSHFIFYF